MKPILTSCFAVVLWAVVALNPAVVRAQPYSVTLPPGFSTFVNHLAPASIDDLIGPGVAEMQVIFPNPAVDFASLTYQEPIYSDGAGWLDAQGLPVTRFMGTGEGVWIYNPGPAVTQSIPYDPVNRPVANGSIVQGPSGSLPGVYLRGRMNTGLGTFESTFGRNPRDFTYIHVHRFRNHLNSFEQWQFFNGNAVPAANAKWFPSVTVLEVGEAAFFELGPLVSGAPFPYGKNGFGAFEISGITTAEGVDGINPFPAAGAPPIYITGSGFTGFDGVRLKSMVANPDNLPFFDVFDAVVTPVDPYLMKVDFGFNQNANGYFGGHYQGNYQLQVTRNAQNGSTAPLKILNNVFHLKSALSPYKLTLTGPSLIKVGFPYAYVLTVANTGATALGGKFKVSVDVNSGGNSSTTAQASSVTQNAPPPAVSSSGSSTKISATMTAGLTASGTQGDRAVYLIQLMPNSGHALKTVDLVARLKATATGSTILPGDEDEVRLSVEIVP